MEGSGVRLAVIGTGYVGLATGVALAYLGHDVTAVDKDQRKVAMLSAGRSLSHEPGVKRLITEVRGRLRFTDRTEEAVGEADVILIAVGTPARENGAADTRHVEEAAREVAGGLRAGRTYTLVVKSTVPIGSNHRVAHAVNETLLERETAVTVHVASNPEFLREGFALRDIFYPDRIVVGSEHADAIEAVRRLYQPILEQTFVPPDWLPRPEGYVLPPLITTDPVSSEMIKYAANAFLALKISFANEMAGLCERVGADVTEVTRGIGVDARIGPGFLGAGLGWGGSCFPKDTAALLAVGAEHGYAMPIVQAARAVNSRQRQVVVEKLQAALGVLRGCTVGILGLAFKPNTDDVRESPALAVIRLLVQMGAHVKAHDPVAIANARRDLQGIDVEFCEEVRQVALNSDGLVLATEWDLYRHLDLGNLAAYMRRRVLVDGRNLYHPSRAHEAGFIYMGVGRCEKPA